MTLHNFTVNSAHIASNLKVLSNHLHHANQPMNILERKNVDAFLNLAIGAEKIVGLIEKGQMAEAHTLYIVFTDTVYNN